MALPLSPPGGEGVALPPEPVGESDGVSETELEGVAPPCDAEAQVLRDTEAQPLGEGVPMGLAVAPGDEVTLNEAVLDTVPQLLRVPKAGLGLDEALPAPLALALPDTEAHPEGDWEGDSGALAVTRDEGVEKPVPVAPPPKDGEGEVEGVAPADGEAATEGVPETQALTLAVAPPPREPDGLCVAPVVGEAAAVPVPPKTLLPLLQGVADTLPQALATPLDEGLGVKVAGVEGVAPEEGDAPPLPLPPGEAVPPPPGLALAQALALTVVDAERHSVEVTEGESVPAAVAQGEGDDAPLPLPKPPLLPLPRGVTESDGEPLPDTLPVPPVRPPLPDALKEGVVLSVIAAEPEGARVGEALPLCTPLPLAVEVGGAGDGVPESEESAEPEAAPLPLAAADAVASPEADTVLLALSHTEPLTDHGAVTVALAVANPLPVPDTEGEPVAAPLPVPQIEAVG